MECRPSMSTTPSSECPRFGHRAWEVNPISFSRPFNILNEAHVHSCNHCRRTYVPDTELGTLVADPSFIELSTVFRLCDILSTFGHWCDEMVISSIWLYFFFLYHIVEQERQFISMHSFFFRWLYVKNWLFKDEISAQGRAGKHTDCMLVGKQSNHKTTNTSFAFYHIPIVMLVPVCV